MSSKAITIYTPPGSTPHIAAQDDAFIYDSLLGGRSGILGELVCQRIDDSTVRLYGGGASNMGFILWVPSGEYCELNVPNGSQGLGRHDIVAAQFTKGDGAAPDEHEFVIVQGAAAAEPTDPLMTTSTLLNAGDVNQLALFRIVHSGLSVTAVEPIAVNASAAPVVAVSESCTGNAATATVAAACSGNAASADTAAVCTGNSATASALAEARSIILSGDLSGSVSFDGSDDVTVNASVLAVNGRKLYIQQAEPSSPSEGDLWIW